MVVYEISLKVQSGFSVQSMTKNFVIKLFADQSEVLFLHGVLVNSFDLRVFRSPGGGYPVKI